MMRRIIGVILVVAIIAGGWWGYGRLRQPQADSVEPSSVALADEEHIVSASATLLPERYASLSARAGGRVQTMFVKAGQSIAAGDTLVQLADADLKAAVAQADAALAAAEAELARVKAGARREQIAQAEAGLAAAQANLARLSAGARAEEITQAEAALAAAAARLAQVRSGTRAEQTDVAEAQVRQAETALARAQDLYDRNRWIGGQTEREFMYQRDAAGAALATARSQLAALQAPAQAEDITAAQAQVTQAKAQLDLIRAGATAHEITAAQAQVAQAQAQLDLIKAGASAEELAAAQAQVEGARAATEQARALLAETALQAPFAGTVTTVFLRAGETAPPTQPIMVVADLSTLHLETDDLSETFIAQVRLGQPATVSFEALPGVSFTGRVTRIASMSSLKQGGTNYAVTIDLEKLDPALRWGMTARVEIDTQE